MYIKYVPYNNNPKYYKDSANCSIFYIPMVIQSTIVRYVEKNLNKS